MGLQIRRCWLVRLIRSADWIVDLGPDGGDKCGEIVFSGTTEEVVAHPSHTGRYLKQVLEHSPPESWLVVAGLGGVGKDWEWLGWWLAYEDQM